MIYKAKKSQVSYGEAIGILLMETFIPFPPGDVGNATTFSFPVRYKVVKGASVERLVNKADPTLIKPFIDAGWDLIKEGVRAITGDCGFMILYQDELAKEFPVPVFMSPLLQIPFILKMLGPQDKVGIVCATSKGLTEKHLKMAGLEELDRVSVVGMQSEKEFYKTIFEETGLLDFNKIEQEVVKVCKGLVEKDRNIKVLLLECSDLPPYAASVQKVVNMPVFDFTTMINFVFSALIRKRFDGFL
ncbi:aspartate/glutamate racemase family protein [Thermodesulfobacteriota bacterium]